MHDTDLNRAMAYECREAIQPIVDALCRLNYTQIPKMILHSDGEIERIYDPEYLRIEKESLELAERLQKSIIDRYRSNDAKGSLPLPVNLNILS